MFEFKTNFKIVEKSTSSGHYRVKPTYMDKGEFWLENQNGKINMGATASQLEYAVKCLNSSGYTLVHPEVEGAKDYEWSGRAIIFIRFDIKQQNKIQKEMINQLNNVHDMIDIVHSFCEEAHKHVYDLTQSNDYKRVFSKFICQYKGESKEYFDVHPSGWYNKKENKNTKIYNILNIDNLVEMKKKKYIISNFGCDDTLVYFTKEEFKDFIKFHING